MKAPTKSKGPVAVAVPEFKVWCDRCCIRIAPNEERTMVHDKAYHVNCHSKLPASTLSASRA